MESAGKKIRRIIRLDGRSMRDRSSTHDYLKERLGFPDHYGNNLDALYDLLTELSRPVKVILIHGEALTDHQPDYGLRILRVLQQAEQANPYFTFDIAGEDSLSPYRLSGRLPDTSQDNRT